ncbi:ATP-dependent helicase [Putridiphycobacter roseus]|uniref:ATP-dependent helicase n=1 Tax=Putridiphycobacter roseus TaxID=2219161 RepID=A0A2W1ND06_9FLAO|nr:DEAD/DEAH box helicase [Putridiphycobacter roseus]PZE16983.1 ATP-dependent helicase [Putridiphycobacter roseus]
MKFSDYPIALEIKQNLEDLKMIRPTDIQFKTISPIMREEDVLAIAQTGTGKTAAFVIPILDRIQKSKTSRRSEGIRCLVMVPTRELALQITEAFHDIGRNLKVKTSCVFGGVGQDDQILALEKGIDILVTTPGRMFDFLHQGHIRLNRVEILVLDEADHMLDLGFVKDIDDVINFLPKNRQTLFFSATIDKKIKKLAYNIIRGNAIHIQISPKDPVSKNVEHSVAHIEMDDKRFFLERLVKEQPEAKILVFVRTQVRAERVCAAMERVGVISETLHGGKDQNEREAALNAFKSGHLKLLIATDVSARGIDIPMVDFVVNYDLPEQAENYVHRVGRTGRGNEKGLAISFCSPAELPLLEEIEGYITKPITVAEITKTDYHETLVFKQEEEGDWKSVMAEIQRLEETYEDKKKKKKKKK